MFRDKHPDHTVITYINCSAGMKALSDIICTSSNARQIVESLPADQPIIFAPDKNLGAYINKQTGRNMLLWNGACMVHEIFSLEKITKLKIRHPKAKIIAHPECEEQVFAVLIISAVQRGYSNTHKLIRQKNILWLQKPASFTRCRKTVRTKHLFPHLPTMPVPAMIARI
jgi:quinolinate synthase